MTLGPRLSQIERPCLILGGPTITLVCAVTFVVALGTARAFAAGISYLTAPGIPAKEFPSPRRPVAPIASLSRSAEEHRDSLNEAGEVARLLELKPGMTVGDIGAGSGYYTVRLSYLVAPSGSVVAQDVTREYLIELRRRTARLRLTNVIFAMGEPHDPRLPKSSLDAAILGHMYHEIAQPYALLYDLAPAFKPGARIGIVDFERPTSRHGTPIVALRTVRRWLWRDRHASARRRRRILGGVYSTARSGSKIAARYRCLYGQCWPALILASRRGISRFCPQRCVARSLSSGHHSPEYAAIQLQ
ncbi:class I SAM-dependent methyltransferase [Bradyrhizobium sp. Cp5.3]|uniref:class I SAM-dependent methyltransferase n=1 Tax=Bradyrhizobium sp. Cp5.3 TaxID=443598 RepID=UPI001FD91472|nr:methyltransferase domain-containing protein [Bradyrhizobium sp. Cp5.3]